MACNESEVTVDVQGGKLLGIENGDLSDNTPYATSTRRSMDGRLIVFVRTSGPTTVVLTSPGLPEVRIER